MTHSRRMFLGAAGAALALPALPTALRAAAPSGPAIHVMKDPGCGCCSAWVDILRAAGFDVTEERMANGLLVRRKVELGLPQAAMSCHTALIDGYVIEGHVPVGDILRLLEERPDAIGLSTPGMPYGSPGMGPEDEREAYDVVLIGKDGGLTRWAHYPAA
ncbi:DUF411 domain-containing protein [Rhodovulum sp. DZ06]|uniref:DUF411 domain-containing protein n=1 Tax=Rhodovulum sp. DZ06 TaxID=3425126 RepID=UPI003D32AF8A